MLNFIKNKISYIIIVAISLTLSLTCFLLILGKDNLSSFLLCLCLFVAGGVCRLFAKKFGVASLTAIVTAVAVYWAYAVIRAGVYILDLLTTLLVPTIYITAVMSMFALGDMTASILLDVFKGERKKGGDAEKTEENRRHSKAALIAYPIFAFCAFAFGAVIFIINAERITAPTAPGMWFGPSIEPIFIMLMSMCVFIVVTIFIKALKVLMDWRIKISFLLILAIAMPIFQFCTADSLFFYGQPLHFTIEEGGIFYPIYERRNAIKSDSYDVEDDGDFVRLDANALGRGDLFELYVSYDNRNDDQSHRIWLDAGFESKVEYFEVYVTPRSDIAPEKVEFYVFEEEDRFQKDSFELSSEVLSDGRIKVTVKPHWEKTGNGRYSDLELKWNINK